jgi:hypothetical protein
MTGQGRSLEMTAVGGGFVELLILLLLLFLLLT